MPFTIWHSSIGLNRSDSNRRVTLHCSQLRSISSSVGKESACNAGDLGLDSWVGKDAWRRKWQPTPVLLPGESHGQRSLAGYIIQATKTPPPRDPYSCLQWIMVIIWLGCVWTCWVFYFLFCIFRTSLNFKIHEMTGEKNSNQQKSKGSTLNVTFKGNYLTHAKHNCTTYNSATFYWLFCFYFK